MGTEDLNDHMLIQCVKLEELWNTEGNWTTEIGISNYNIDEKNIILGELNKTY